MKTPSSPSVLIGDPGFVLIVFEMGFQPPREAAFAGGHPAHYARKDWDEVRHANCEDLPGISVALPESAAIAALTNDPMRHANGRLA